MRTILGIDACATGDMTPPLASGLSVLFLVLVLMLTMATVVVAGITMLCVHGCRREGTLGARLFAAAWGLVLVGGLGYATLRMDDMTLDPSQGDFWWSAWMTIAALGGALAAWTGAALGRAEPRD